MPISTDTARRMYQEVCRDRAVRRVVVPASRVGELAWIATDRRKTEWCEHWIGDGTVEHLLGVVGEEAFGLIYGTDRPVRSEPEGDGGVDMRSPYGFRIDVKVRQAGDLAIRPVEQQTRNAQRTDVLVFGLADGALYFGNYRDCLITLVGWAHVMDVSAWPAKVFAEGLPETHYRAFRDLPDMAEFEESIWPNEDGRTGN